MARRRIGDMPLYEPMMWFTDVYMRHSASVSWRYILHDQIFLEKEKALQL